MHGEAPPGAALRPTLPIAAVVFAGFLVIGLALPVLPLHVAALGYGAGVVGMVTGSQFAAALLTRVWAGGTADRHGPKRAVLAGLGSAAVAGALYFISGRMPTPLAALATLLVGRAVLGGAESFVITGATAWGLARAGAVNAGQVIAWTGTAMFAALAAGAPLGTVLYRQGGFAAVALATVALPLATTALAAALRPAEPTRRGGPALRSVLRQIWVPGVVAALASLGYGALVTFGTLLFSRRCWTPVWLPFTAYATALITARLLLGHLPDRHGGARVALASLAVEAGGLALMAAARSAAMAAAGAALVGLGNALVFPGFGVGAVRRALAEARGVAMGAYTACLDLALSIGGPVLGLVADRAGLSAAFLASGAVVAGAVPIAIAMMLRGRHGG